MRRCEERPDLGQQSQDRHGGAPLTRPETHLITSTASGSDQQMLRELKRCVSRSNHPGVPPRDEQEGWRQPGDVLGGTSGALKNKRIQHLHTDELGSPLVGGKYKSGRRLPEIMASSGRRGSPFVGRLNPLSLSLGPGGADCRLLWEAFHAQTQHP